MSAACIVAMADRRELPLERWMPLLSPRERAEADTYRHPARRERTIASRLMAKFLVGEPRTAEFRRLDARDIDAAGNAEWTSIELLSGPARARSGATVFRSGEAARDLSASSSHCGDYTAACIGRSRVGIDLERIETRRAEFYAGSFSAEERSWAQQTGAAEAAFTLLWSVKEAYLKVSNEGGFSVWAFPRWTVRFRGAVDRVLRPDGREGFVRVPGGIRGPGDSRPIEITARRVGDMILSTVHPGAANDE